MTNKIIYLGLMGMAAPVAAMAASADKPNIVFIVADDLGWGDVSYHGSVINTPNIDRLANDGIELNRFYTAPVSSPTRAGLMTGRYPNRFGIRETVIPPWREYGLDHEEYTIADVLGENGYDNRAMIGKWHLGHGRKVYYPLNRGFTHFYGCLNGAIDYFSHERDGELDWHRGWDSSYDKGYSTNLITQEAVNCINNYSKEGPFFLYVAYNAPHSPFQAPDEEIYKHISKKEFDQLKKREQDGYIYRAMVEVMDRGIGQILSTLDKSGELENTIVLFMSDNGGVPNLASGSTNLPLRGNKFLEWDGGVRVPAALYWERGFKHGMVSNQVTGFVDMLPTIADIVGVEEAPQRAYDGVSIYSILTGQKSTIERDFYLGMGAAVNNDYKMVIAGRNDKMNIDRDYLVYYPEDAYEAKNSIDEHKAEAARLKNIIVEYDNIVPSHEELPYGAGKEGFVPPREWYITKP